MSRLVLRSALASTFFLSLLLVGCSPNLGPSIEVPDLSSPKLDNATNVGGGRMIAVVGFEDFRPRYSAGSEVQAYTQPEGDVLGEIEKSIGAALTQRGFGVSSTAPIRLTGRLLKWQTKTTAKTSARVESVASITVDVVDASNRILYSATYNGSRSSEAPLATKDDVKTSLAIAAEQAIEQLAEDSRLLDTLRSF